MAPSFKNSSPLALAQERALIALAQRGDRKARDRLILANTRYVLKLANSRAYRSSSGETSIEDYVQEGLMALHIAIDKFDTTKAPATMRLIGYAHAWIKVRQGNRALYDMSIVKYGTTQEQRTMFSSLSRVIDELSYLLRREPTDEELAAHMKVKVSDIVAGRQRLGTRDLSLNAKLNRNSEEGLEFIDQHMVPASDAEDLLILAEERRNDARNVNVALSQLDVRERYVIEKRHMVEEGDIPTLAEIGILWGCSRERVRQIESRAFTKLHAIFGVSSDGKSLGRYRKKNKSRDQIVAGDRRDPGREVCRKSGGGQTAHQCRENRSAPAAGTPRRGSVPPLDKGSDLCAGKARRSRRAKPA